MSVISVATGTIGKVKYLFGADDVPHGLADCSAWSRYCYKKGANIDIGRDTKTQLANCEQIKKEDLQAGDLVFFQGTYRRGVSHVGIFYKGTQFIHMDESKGCTVSDLESKYYKNHWLTGGRVNGYKEQITDKLKDLDLSNQKDTDQINSIVIIVLILMLIFTFFIIIR